MYANGKGVLKDLSKAKYWIKKAYEGPDQLLFDTNIRLAYHLLTRLYQKHTQSQDWIVLLL
jgi:TPR repeat protein